jgi:hybrid cluster-associated redox disulfide protein
MEKISLDMIISDVLQMDKGLAPIFYNNGLFCLGCPSASGESIRDACQIHGIDSDKLIKELNEYFNKE